MVKTGKMTIVWKILSQKNPKTFRRFLLTVADPRVNLIPEKGHLSPRSVETVV